MKGTIVNFDDKKGYGFIQPDSQSEQIFVHATAVSNGARPAAGQRVTFDVASSPKGPRASNVVIDGAAAKTTPSRGHSPFSPYWLFGGIAVVATLLVFAALMSFFSLSWLWSYLIGINLTTFLLYVYDKSIAGSGASRVPERILHGAELAGGTPAGFVGQRVLHHKNAKGSYQRTFWIIFIVQVILVIALVYLGAA